MIILMVPQEPGERLPLIPPDPGGHRQDRKAPPPRGHGARLRASGRRVQSPGARPSQAGIPCV
jgi:hypothetical protein